MKTFGIRRIDFQDVALVGILIHHLHIKMVNVLQPFETTIWERFLHRISIQVVDVKIHDVIGVLFSIIVVHVLVVGLGVSVAALPDT